MPKIRSIKPELCTSEQLINCSRVARLLFRDMLMFADDNGIIPYKPIRIKMLIFPGDNDTKEDMIGYLDELESNELIKTYKINDQKYIKYTGFLRHQQIKKGREYYAYPIENGDIPVKSLTNEKALLKPCLSPAQAGHEPGTSPAQPLPEPPRSKSRSKSRNSNNRVSEYSSNLVDDTPNLPNSCSLPPTNLKNYSEQAKQPPTSKIFNLLKHILPTVSPPKFTNDKKSLEFQVEFLNCWKQHPETQAWDDVFTMCTYSDFLMGKKPGKDKKLYHLHFEFIVRSFEQIKLGKYSTYEE